MSTEVTIRGAGIFGLSIAWSLIERGARVRIIDPQGPGAGASGGILGSLSPHVPENWNEKKAFQFDSLEMAGTLLAGRNRGLLRPRSWLRPHRPPATHPVRGRSGSRPRPWRGGRNPLAGPLPMAGDPGHGRADQGAHGLADPRQPQRPPAAKTGHHRPGPSAQTPGRNLHGHARGPEVWATGAHGLADLSAELGKPVGAGIKGQAALLDLDIRGTPQLFVDGLHIIPHGDGTTAIGSTTERDFADPTSTDAKLDALITKARTALPVLAQAPVLERWAGLRPRAKSRAPLLGPHPTRPGIFIANGGFKIGFGMAPKVGEVMADLILDGTNTIPASFRVDANF